MNDYWDYLAHARQSKEADNHKYIARVQVGTKNGYALYRYFYSKEEYQQYLKGHPQKKTTAVEELKSFGQKVRQTVVNAANTAKETAANTAKNVKSAVDDAVENAKKKISKAKETCSNVLKIIGSVKVSQVSNAGKKAVEDSLAKAKTYYEAMKGSADKDRTKNALKSDEVSVLKGVKEKSIKVLSESVEDAVRIIHTFKSGTRGKAQDSADCALAYELRARGYDARPSSSPLVPTGKETIVNSCIDQMMLSYTYATAIAINPDGSTIDFTDYQNRSYFDKNKEWYDEEISKLQQEASNAETKGGERLWRELANSLGAEYLYAKGMTYYLDYLVTESTEYNLQKQQMEKRNANPKEYLVDASTITRTLAKESGTNSRGIIAYQNWNGEQCCCVYEVDSDGDVRVIDPDTGNANVNLKTLRMYNVCYVQTNDLEMRDIVLDRVNVK